MNISDKLKVVHLASSMLGVPVFILLVVLVLILDADDVVKELLA